MKEERKFLRLCCICRKYKTKNELIRITKNYKNKEIVINNDNLITGRSIYICKNQECIEKFIKNKKVLYSLKSEMTENIKDTLCTVLKN